MKWRLVLSAAFLFAALTLGPTIEAARACPMCRAANETESSLPLAYMYSILFMLAVPASVLTGFGIGFYRLSKKQQADLEAGGFRDKDDLEP